MLDVGCGWGSFAIHAAQRHGVHVTGITLSPPQVERARRRAEEAGVADRTDFRVADYRELAGESFDAVASIGMVEHVGAEQMDEYARRLRGALRPGGRLLNHGIANLRQEDPQPGRLLRALRLPRRRAAAALARAARARARRASRRTTSRASATTTPRRCATGRAGSTRTIDEAMRLAGPERVRVWRLYLRAARNGFETGFTSIYQVRAS